MIEKIKGKWYLFAKKTGKILGKHKTKRDAVAQEHAVNLSKARAAGYQIPYRPRKRKARR